MYNFDPLAVEHILKEMKTLAANGHSIAHGMRARIRGMDAAASATEKKSRERSETTQSSGIKEVDAASHPDAEESPVAEENERRGPTRQVGPSTKFEVVIRVQVPPEYMKVSVQSTWASVCAKQRFCWPTTTVYSVLCTGAPRKMTGVHGYRCRKRLPVNNWHPGYRDSSR